MRYLFKSLLLIAVFMISGCGIKPDGNSGGDAERYQAKKIELGQQVSDSVDYNGGDRTDWKYLYIEDPGILQINVLVDNQEAGLVVELYDRYGHFIARSDHVVGPSVQLMHQVTLGKYFIKIYARKRGDKTGYTLITRMVGG